MSSSVAERPTHPMVAALADAAAALDEALEGNAWSLSDDELADLLAAQAVVPAKAVAMGVGIGWPGRNGRVLGIQAGAPDRAYPPVGASSAR